MGNTMAVCVFVREFSSFYVSVSEVWVSAFVH